MLIPGADLDRSDSYLVRRGDTLSAIAEHELGDRDRWSELYEANRFQLADADQLPVGIRLELPATSSTNNHEKASARHKRRN